MTQKKYRTLIIAGIVILIISSITGAFLMLITVNNRLLNQIGVYYYEDEEGCREYIAHFFEAGYSSEKVNAGEDALEKYGYTDRGLFYLIRHIGVFKIFTGLIIMQVLIIAIIIVCMNKAERKRREAEAVQLNRIKELEKLKAQEEYQQEQNRRIQAFIENVAHQIKTPLSRISVSLDIIAGEGLDADEHSRRIEECFSHVDGINQLMKRLMDIGRLEAGKIIFKKEQICMEELFLDIINDFNDSGSFDLQVTFDKAENISFYGDYEWLKEAFSNIVKNAFEHDSSNEPIKIICNREKEYFTISIRDNGTGFREVDIPNLFDRFYLPEETKSNHIGIGLNFAKLIIEGHFGSIHARNHEEGGAVFDILLPVYNLKEKK